ncbi:hypothetical protein ACP70R_044037 [Stipagrostis hirtigluma subsp. patula]
MEPACTNLTEVARSVQLLKINGYSMTTSMTNSEYIKTTWHVDGYEWEVRLFPAFTNGCDWVALKFIFLREVGASEVKAKISCRVVDPSGNLQPCGEKSVYKVFWRPQASVFIMLIKTRDVLASSYLLDDSLTVECTIAVLKDIKDIIIPEKKELPLPPLPSSDMHQHFGKLLQSQTGSDVMFAVSGESFAAHKLVLAARSPVFMAEFFGSMEERTTERVEIEDMEAAVFKAMLHFIYTDTVPELDEEPEAAVTMAQHLLAAADRYGLDRLKLICEGNLAGGIDVDTAATTLALAEQHNCSLLKDKCLEFITAAPEKLDAVLATEGYKHLVASCPLMLTELVKAARGMKI